MGGLVVAPSVRQDAEGGIPMRNYVWDTGSLAWVAATGTYTAGGVMAITATQKQMTTRVDEASSTVMYVGEAEADCLPKKTRNS